MLCWIGHTAAPGSDHARRELWIGAIHLVGAGAVKRARAGDLRDGAIVDVLNLRVQLGVVVEGVVRKGAGGIALVRTLVVVQRTEVVTVRIAERHQRPDATDKMQRPASAEVLAELIDEAESARGRRGGSGAAEMAARHVGACCRARAD